MICPSLQEGKPCGGERLLLMFDRWRKLLKAFHNEKKRQFDISKVGFGAHLSLDSMLLLFCDGRSPCGSHGIASGD